MFSGDLRQLYECLEGRKKIAWRVDSSSNDKVYQTRAETLKQPEESCKITFSPCAGLLLASNIKAVIKVSLGADSPQSFRFTEATFQFIASLYRFTYLK